jgi:hypothetical protein
MDKRFLCCWYNIGANIPSSGLPCQFNTGGLSRQTSSPDSLNENPGSGNIMGRLFKSGKNSLEQRVVEIEQEGVVFPTSQRDPFSANHAVDREGCSLAESGWVKRYPMKSKRASFDHSLYLLSDNCRGGRCPHPNQRIQVVGQMSGNDMVSLARSRDRAFPLKKTEWYSLYNHLLPDRHKKPDWSEIQIRVQPVPIPDDTTFSYPAFV